MNDPIETATVWNRDLLDQPNVYAEALDRWLAYYRELGIEHLGYACLVLRKRSDGRDGWLEAQQLPRAHDEREHPEDDRSDAAQHGKQQRADQKRPFQNDFFVFVFNDCKKFTHWLPLLFR